MAKQNSKIPDKVSTEEETVLISGFGGQGIMALGKIIAQIVVLENKNVTYIPSYGAEMRGGTAHCMVRISKKEIASPIFDKATIGIMMNKPSLEKFKNRFVRGATVYVNRSLIRTNVKIKDVNLYCYPFSDMANSLGNIKVANIIILGALLSQYGLARRSSAVKTLREYFGNKPHMLELNLKALDSGWKIN